MADPHFPNYLEMPTRVPLWVWRALRVAAVGVFLAIAMASIVAPDDTLILFWVFSFRSCRWSSSSRRDRGATSVRWRP